MQNGLSIPLGEGLRPRQEIRPDHKFLLIGTIFATAKLITTRFRPIKGVIATFAPNIACPYMGVFFMNERTTREKREENERRTREDFSQNYPFQPFLTPIYGSCPLHSAA
jgi:hypothetical protein